MSESVSADACPLDRDAADRAALQSPDWRRGAAAALATGLGDWLARDGELAERLRR